MTTIIHSNGSKWAGQEPDSIDTLLDVLKKYPLDPTFEDYGNFFDETEGVEKPMLSHTGVRIYPDNPRMIRFFGNFMTLSHVFTIDSDDPVIIEKLSEAIRKNQQRQDYQEQRQAMLKAKRKEEEAKNTYCI